MWDSPPRGVSPGGCLRIRGVQKDNMRPRAREIDKCWCADVESSSSSSLTHVFEAARLDVGLPVESTSKWTSLSWEAAIYREWVKLPAAVTATPSQPLRGAPEQQTRGGRPRGRMRLRTRSR
eukprot:scaffold101079_cov69-Phaeocystis_antarctica.AAC.1